MSHKLAGKVALVTGASKSIGQGLAIGLAAAGARLAVNYKTDAEGAQTTCQRIRQAGGEAEAFQADIGSKAEFERLVDRVCERFGRLDVLVNNAAVDISNTIEAMRIEEWRKTFAINVDGVMFGMKHAVALMKTHGGGSIVNISSIASMVSAPTNTAYSTSKAAVVGLSRTVALHCAAEKYAIRVNCIHPGPIRTPMVMKYATENPQFLEMMQASIPVGSMGDPIDIANGALYLACEESKWVTGSSLVIDGGFTAR